MDWLEEELKRALARKEPPPGFAARVRPQAGGRAAGALTRRWLALAASVIVVAGGATAYRQYQGIRAKEQVISAVRLAAAKLNRVQNQVKEIGQ